MTLSIDPSLFQVLFLFLHREVQSSALHMDKNL